MLARNVLLGYVGECIVQQIKVAAIRLAMRCAYFCAPPFSQHPQ
jgi:hypothetical protein